MYINDDLLASIGKESIQHLLRDLHKEFEVADNKEELFLVLQILREKGGSIALYQTDVPYQKCESSGNTCWPSQGRGEPSLGSHERGKASQPLPAKLLKDSLGCGETDPQVPRRCGKLRPATLSNGWYRHLTSYITKFGFRLVFWSPQRRQTTALSTTAVGYVTACQTTKEVMWFRRLLNEHLGPAEILETLYMGNESTIKLIKHSLCHRRTKHMKVLYQYTRQAYEKGVFKLQYIPSNNLNSGHTYQILGAHDLSKAQTDSGNHPFTA